MAFFSMEISLQFSSLFFSMGSQIGSKTILKKESDISKLWRNLHSHRKLTTDYPSLARQSAR
jgi:hypothetical protein